METIHRVVTLLLAAGLAGSLVGNYCLSEDLKHKQTVLEQRTAESIELRQERNTLQAKWDKEQGWVGRYKVWREEWVKKHQLVIPIEAFDAK